LTGPPHCRIVLLKKPGTIEIEERDLKTKLTLRLDEHLIASAKEYSAKTGKSVSKIVSDFFIVIRNEKLKKNRSLTPTVQSLKGTLKNSNFSKNSYKNYLEDKYL
jgi:hypothetical protein